VSTIQSSASPAQAKRHPDWWVVFVASLGAFLDGYDLVIIAGALLFITPELSLSPAEVGWVGSVAFVGMIGGALVFGRLTDRIGRNTSFVLVLVLFVIGSAISALSQDAWMLILGRFIVGLGIGADLPVSTTLIAEAVPAKNRGRSVGLMQGFWFAGATVSGIVGIVLYLLLGASSWRWMLGSAIVIAIVVILLRRSIGESQRWLKARNDASSPPAARATVTKPLVPLLRNKAVRTTLIFSCLFWFLVTVRGAGFNLYTPTFLSQVGLTGIVQTLVLSCVINLVNAIVAIAAAVFFVDRVGRRKFVLIWWAVTLVLTLGLAFAVGGNVILMFVLISVSALPNQIVTVALFSLSVESFPTLQRATAQGLSSASGKLGGFIAALAVPVILATLGWTYLTLILGGVMLIGLIIGFILRFPETRGVSLDEVDRDREDSTLQSV
jgi:MFS transporter, putative metabolite transport protein